MKSKLHSATRILTIFLIIAILTMPVISIISIKPVSAADVTLPFSDGFETGDFTKWNGGSGGSVTSGSAYDGTYKAVFSTSYRQAIFTSTPAAHCFMRAYVWLDTAPSSGVSSSILGLCAGSNYQAEALIGNVAGTLKWELRYFDAGVTHTAVSTQTLVVHKWYCVEVEGKDDSTTAAQARMYVDGIELTDVTQTNLSDTIAAKYGYLWISASSGAPTVWYDDVEIATSYIGTGPATLTTSTDGHGSISKSPDYAHYSFGTVVTVQAHANPGYSFAGWGGDLGGSTNPTTITMSSDKTVTATFNALPTTVEVDPATSYVTVLKSFTVNVDVANVVGLTSWQFKLYYDNTVLRCVSPTEGVTEGQFLQSAGATIFGMEYHNTEGYVLAYCTLKGTASASGSGVLATVTFYGSAVGDTSLQLIDTKLGDTAIPPNPITHTDIDGTVHVQSFTLTVNVVGTGCSVNPDHPGPYHYGETVQLTAVHANGWTFAGWTGAPAGNPTTITITGDMTVTATFTQDEYTLTVDIVGTGTVDKSPDKATYHYGDIVTLTAHAGLGWTFDHWTGASGGSSTTVTMTGSMTVTATFTQDQYTLTITINGHGSVSKTPDQLTYTYGTTVTLHATPDADWSFQYWTGDPVVGSGETVTITMNGNHAVTANFLNKPTLQMSPTSKTCRMYHENFVVTITISNAANVGSFNFEIDYDTTMLDYVSVTWNVWSTGSITVAGGKITVSNSAGALPRISGTQTLVTITFTASVHHIWKSDPNHTGYTNDLTSMIYFQTISIGYPSGPNLLYSRGDSTQINVGPDFAYTFSPIQGDVDNNGVVDVFDLRAVAAYFDTHNTTYDLVIDGTIDVADIYVVTSNFDFHYVP